uniref:Chalcone-flavanone isomerase n=1 Tax=Angiostrongylus cantonensis TaxID=6313 RepID=A0A0K0D661_ANGCA
MADDNGFHIVCDSERLFFLGGGQMKKAALKKAILQKRQLRLCCMCVTLTFFVAALVYEEMRISSTEKPAIVDVVVNQKEMASAKLSVRSIHPADPNGIVSKYCKLLEFVTVSKNNNNIT